MFKDTKNKVKQGLEPGALETLKSVDLYSVAALVLKVRNSTLLPRDGNMEWIYNMEIPPGTVACPDNDYKCYAKLLAIALERGINVHPSNQIDVLLVNHNVTINDVGVAYGSGDNAKSMGCTSGYLLHNTNDVERMCHASTADLMVTDAKYAKNGSMAPPEWPANFRVPVSDAQKYRPSTQSTTPGRSVPREEIFSYLTEEKNSLLGLRLHTLVGSTMKNLVQVPKLEEQVKEIYEAKREKIPADFNIKIICPMGGPCPWTVDIDAAYRMYFKSIGIRGGSDGKNVSHGYERFSMTRSNAHMVNLVTDFKVMTAKYKCTTVMLQNTNSLTGEEIRYLLANGISIVIPSTPYPYQKKDGKIAVYSKVADKVPFCEYYKIEEDWVRPELASKKDKESHIKFGTYYDSAMNLLAKRTRCFSYIYLDSRLTSYEGNVSLFPTCFADTLKVIVATGFRSTFKVPELVQRGTMAVSCRNRFVHNRKPFCEMDPMADAVKWNTLVIFPRVKCREKKTLDLELCGVEEGALDIKPPNIDFSKARVRAPQAKTIKLKGYDQLVKAYKENREILFRVIMGAAQGNHKLYVKNLDRAWSADYPKVIDMQEELAEGFLDTIDVDGITAKDEYIEFKRNNYVEQVPFSDREVPVPIVRTPPTIEGAVGRVKLDVNLSNLPTVEEEGYNSEEDG